MSNYTQSRSISVRTVSLMTNDSGANCTIVLGLNVCMITLALPNIQSDFLQLKQPQTGSNSIIKVGENAKMHVWIKLSERTCYLLL